MRFAGWKILKKLILSAIFFIVIFLFGAFSTIYEKQIGKSYILSAKDHIEQSLKKWNIYEREFPDSVETLRYDLSVAQRYPKMGVYQLAIDTRGQVFAVERFSGSIYLLDESNGKMNLIGDIFKEISANSKKDGTSLQIMDLHYGFGRFFISVVKVVEGGKSESLGAYSFELRNNRFLNFHEFFASPTIEDRLNSAMWAGRFTNSKNSLFLSVGEQRFDRSGFPKISINASAERLNPDSVFGSVLEFKLKSDDFSKYEIFSRGHRNAQGLFYSLDDAALYESEHGPFCGDEVNKLKRGSDYGWPKVSLGNAYGWPMSEVDSKNFDISETNLLYELELNKLGFKRGTHVGFTPPMMSWCPGNGLSALRQIPVGSKLDFWSGNLLVGTLATKELHRLTLSGNNIISDEKINIGFRIRDFVLLNRKLIISTDEGQLVSMKILSKKKL